MVELWAWSSESLGESRHCVQIFRAPAALLNSPPALPCSCCIFYTQQCIWWTTLQGTVEDQWRKPLATRQTQVPVKTPPCPPLSWWAKAPSLVKVAQTQNALIISQVQVLRLPDKMPQRAWRSNPASVYLWYTILKSDDVIFDKTEPSH